MKKGNTPCGLPDQKSASQGQGKTDVLLLDHGEREGGVLENTEGQSHGMERN